MMDELIDYLRNNTILARFSRGDVRELLERLDADGYALTYEGKPGDVEGDLSDVIRGVNPAPRRSCQRRLICLLTALCRPSADGAIEPHAD